MSYGASPAIPRSAREEKTTSSPRKWPAGEEPRDGVVGTNQHGSVGNFGTCREAIFWGDQVAEWKYRKIALNEHHRLRDDID